MLRLNRLQIIAALLLLVALAAPLQAATLASGIKMEKPLGFQIITPTVATQVTVPAGAKHVMVSVRYFGCYMTDDGTTPSATNGIWLPPGFVMKFDNDRDEIRAWRFLDTSDGASKVYLKYSGDQ